MLICLDRDGVINQDSEAYIKSPEEWHAIPGSLEAIARLTTAGYTIAVITNQSGLGRGLFDLKTLVAIHEKMLREIRAVGGEVAAIFYCPHLPGDQCACRKPQPGLLLQAKEYFQVTLKGVWMVGDTFRDVEAARAVGCQPVLVKTGKGKLIAETTTLPTGCLVFDDLAAVADALVC